MKLRIATIISTCLVVLPLALAGCDEQSEKTAAEAGTVKASPAYLEHFGQPPTPEEGTCFARVGFYSLRDDPDKIRAVPFFLYRETGQLQQLLERLVSGAVPLPPESGLVSPFPEETSVAVQSRDEGGVTLDLIFNDRQPSGQDLKAIAAVLTETAVQFEAVESVVILRDGKPLPGAPKEGYRHAPERVSAVKSPVLFMVIADWQEGQSGPEE
ncbi:MAG: GerMN domain-containing protein, partial [Desulfuromonadales bacterium]|nr:GerMN domain-containing protein [Desulfuromonadales bacterium]NIR34250.1 GerMN domain-containing protein [Desulfuromonadales bacterium]NIS44237.1 GerMN domain-containing protein [Desulfuromonadales bacterium]